MKTVTWKSRSIRAVIATALVTMVAAFGSPIPADADGAGAPLTFSGTASLPKFPCPPADASCVGTFEGTVSGSFAGEQFGAFEVVLADADLDASFGYSDTNCIEGSALGTVTVSAGLGHVDGRYDRDPDPENPDPLPLPVIGLLAETDFTWDRDLASANLILENGFLQLNVAGIGWIQVMTDTLGAAEAFFAPLLDHENLPGCTPGNDNAPALDAEVVGTASLIDPL